MTILLYLAPIVLVIGLVATGRVSLIKASLAGLMATIPAAALALHGQQDYLPFFALESLKGAWLAWHAIAVTFAGLTIHHVIQAAAPEAETEAAPRSAEVSRHRQAYFLCFIASGLIETAIGFGVGYALAIHGLIRLGVSPLPAIAMGVLSQLLVPWGGLGIGTQIGAALGHLPLTEFGLYSASFMPAFLVILLGWFWWWSKRLQLGITLTNMLQDLAWTVALLGLLWLGNRYASVDTAGLIATAPLLALAQALNPNRPPLKRMLRIAAPYALLLLVLLSTRLTPLGQILQSTGVSQPFDDMPAFPWFYQAGSMLLLTALLYGAVMLKAQRWPQIMAQSWQAGRIAMGTTLIFLVMARLMAASGIPAELATAWQSVAGSHALLATPLFAAIAGGLTGSNTASNSLMLPLQAALAGSAGSDVIWVSALQNVTGSLFTPFFPGKIAMACAFAGIAGAERQTYRVVLVLPPLLLITAVFLTLFL